MNIIERTIAIFSPSVALRRMEKRTALELAKRGYEAARRDRRTDGWKANDGYNDSKTLKEIGEVRNRSRNLFKNNVYAFRSHTSITNNTVGTGILPAIKEKKVKTIWNSWADSLLADFDENLNFYGLQALCMKTMSVSGEVLVLRIHVKNGVAGEVPLQLKVVPPIFLDSNKVDVKNPERIKGGIEFTDNGKRKGYWIFPANPQESVITQSVFWPVKDVIHLYQIDEPGQIRGVPFGTPAMMSLRDFDDYADAQLIRQKIAACFSVFITENDSSPASAFNSADNESLEKVEPGIIEHLPPGKQVSFATPPPAEGYGEYSRNVLTGVSAGFGTTYEAMTGDLSNVNFSSGRMGWLEYQRNIESWQWFIIIPKLCKGVWSWFVEAAILAGKLGKNAPIATEWTAPRRQMIDPVKETQGLVDQVRAGFMSWQEAVRSLGYTPEEILAELLAAKKMFDEAGITPECDPRFDKAKKAPELEKNDNNNN